MADQNAFGQGMNSSYGSLKDMIGQSQLNPANQSAENQLRSLRDQDDFDKNLKEALMKLLMARKNGQNPIQ